MKKSNAVFDDKELHKKPRSFSFEETCLSTRNYKVICSIAIIIVVCITTLLFMPILLGWEPYKNFFATVFAVLVVAMMYVLFFIPVLLGIRVILGYLLKKNIQKLEQEIWKQNKLSKRQSI